jgi:membrane protein implicated in regulation of membrane protease activity
MEVSEILTLLVMIIVAVGFGFAAWDTPELKYKAVFLVVSIISIIIVLLIIYFKIIKKRSENEQ